jgi:LmbE family N-acetylglucosaminyl deacetylase
LRDQPERQVLVLAPHPDDETFGCGGTIRLLAAGATAVDVAFLTRGELGVEGGPLTSHDSRRVLGERRTREAQAACNVLGVREVYFLNGMDTQVREQPQLSESIAELLRQTPYQRVFCPWPGDAHDDHRATFHWLQRATREQPGKPQFWLYEVWKPLAANTFVPIDGTIDVKLRAIDQYPSQLTQMNYRDAFMGLASYRSLFCPPSKFAEAFFVCGTDELLNMAGGLA